MPLRPCGAGFEVDRERLQQLTLELQAPDLWSEPERATQLAREQASCTARVRSLDVLWEEFSDLKELALLSTPADTALACGLSRELTRLAERVQALELEEYFTSQDVADALFTVKAGTGGLEAQDFVRLLVRMYTRWAAREGFGVERLEEVPGEGGGLRQATLRITGRNVYG